MSAQSKPVRAPELGRSGDGPWRISLVPRDDDTPMTTRTAPSSFHAGNLVRTLLERDWDDRSYCVIVQKVPE